MTDAMRAVAAARAEQIRTSLTQLGVLYAQACTERDWHTLGYPSLSAWRTGEFGPDRFSPARRREIVDILTSHGWTVREIARATGASADTVNRDQHQLTPLTADPVTGGAPPASPRQLAARSRERQRRERNAPPTGIHPLEIASRDTGVAEILSRLDRSLADDTVAGSALADVLSQLAELDEAPQVPSAPRWTERDAISQIRSRRPADAASAYAWLTRKISSAGHGELRGIALNLLEAISGMAAEAHPEEEAS